MIRMLVLCFLVAAPAWADPAPGPGGAAAADAEPRPSVLNFLWQADPARQLEAARRGAPEAAGRAAAAAGEADAGEVLTLEQALAMAHAGNRLLRNSVLDVARVDDHIASTKTQRWPQFSVTVTPSYLITPLDLTFDAGVFQTSPFPIPASNTTITTDPGYKTAVQAQVAQPLSQLYKVNLNIDRLEVGRDMSRQDLRAQQQSVASNVKQAYYGVVQLQSALEAQEEHVASNRELVRLVADRVAQGSALPAEHLQAKAALAQAEYGADSARHNLATQKERLNHLLGRALSTPFRAAPLPVPDTGPPMDIEAAQSLALRQRPDLKKADLQVAYVDYGVKLKRAEYIPDVSLVFQYLSPITSENLPRNIAYVGVQISWDVFDWGRKQHELAQLARARDQARNSVEEAASRVALDVNQSYRKLQDSEAFLAVVGLNRDAAREHLRVVTDRYRQQAVLLRDVLAAQAAFAQANDQHRQAALAVWEARAALDRALGRDEADAPAAAAAAGCGPPACGVDPRTPRRASVTR